VSASGSRDVAWLEARPGVGGLAVPVVVGVDPGRHRSLSEGAPDFIVAVDIGGTKMALATADLGGRVLNSARVATDVARGAEQALQRAADRAIALMAKTREMKGAGACVGFAVVAPGVVRAETMLLTPNVPGLERLNLRAFFEAELGLPCLSVSNDVKAAAMAESRWGSLRGADPALFVNVGTGLAAAIVLGGRVLVGAHGAAGEIGYLLNIGSGDAGAADGRAPLEELVGGRAIAERASALLGETVTTGQAFVHTDARVAALVDDALEALSNHVANAAILIDPARIALGGGLMGSAQRVLAAVSRRVSTAVPFPPEIVPATFLRDAPLRGALVLALDALDGARPS
jgi:glucokinase